MNDSVFKQIPEGLIIRCKIQPSASKTAFAGFFNECLKFTVAAPPVDGKANKALCIFIAKKTHISKSKVKISNGDKSKYKSILCTGITEEEFCKVFKINDFSKK